MIKESAIINQQPGFIGAWFLEDLNVCDTLITYFYKNSDLHASGHTQAGNRVFIDIETKDSTDLAICSNCQDKEWAQYTMQLAQVTEAYKKRFEWCDHYSPWGILDQTNIQFYKPGGGYKIWHTERSTPLMPMATRHLVFMTYLNDVTDQGETEFFYQKIKIKPRKGLTAIWPADWTHTHRGISSPTQEKYIITGWFNFY